MLLELKNINYGYTDGNKKRMIIKDLNYTFEEGKLYTIFGPSGSGKTTLLSIAGGLDKTQEGQVLFEGRDILKMGLSKYRRNHLAFVFQQFNLIPYMSALSNIINVMHITDNDIPKPYKQTALNLLNELGIVETKAERNVLKLSGGEQQRVAIARGLATNVDLIFADEPTGNLDTETEDEIIKILYSLAKEFNKCVIIVTHSEKIARHSDVNLALVDGKLMER